MNEEIEYSFKVTDIKDFINYCITYKYTKTEESFQTRILYKNGGPFMARITENIYDNKVINRNIKFNRQKNIKEKKICL